MGASAAETLREIEDIRGRLEADMRELERRVPQPAMWLKRMIGFALGGGMALILLRWVLKRCGQRAELAGDAYVLVRLSDLKDQRNIRKVALKT
ncbi:MAG TPA: hypothetical protein VJ868_02490 [Actinomycetota bacterium]|nr:hypothetical protein [Actinomycetota bacterium]